MEKRYIAFDIGDKRIGIAVSDPFGSMALPVETYHRKNLKTDLAKIVGYVKDKCATALVCGLPVNFDGTPSIQTNKALFFIERIFFCSLGVKSSLYWLFISLILEIPRYSIFPPFEALIGTRVEFFAKFPLKLAK